MVKEFYDELAERYDDLRYGSTYLRRVAELEHSFIQTHLKDGNCLEVGAGTGRVTKFLLDNLRQVTAVDVSPRMLERLKANLSGYKNLTTNVMDIHELNSIEGYGTFDIAVCLRVLPHLENPLDALKQLRGAVSEEGTVIIDLWNSWGYRAILERLRLKGSPVYTHYNSEKEMRAIIDEAGLSIVKYRGIGFPPFRVCLPLEANPRFGLGHFVQRFIWVCQPRRNGNK